MDIADDAARAAEMLGTAAIVTVRRALDRHGTLKCIDCGEPIEQARRLALPSANRCIVCQKEIEAQNRYK